MAWTKLRGGRCARRPQATCACLHTHTTAAETTQSPAKNIYEKHVPTQHQRSAACAGPLLSAHSYTPGLQLCLAQTRLKEDW